MEVGKRVYCKSDDLHLNNVQGTITRTKVLGCEDSVTVTLDSGEQFAFFGPKINCVGINGPLSKDPTQQPQPQPEATQPQTEKPVAVKKRLTKKKISNI